MSNQMNIPEGDSGMKEIPQGPNTKAKLKFYDCKGSGECIKACPENAIEMVTIEA